MAPSHGSFSAALKTGEETVLASGVLAYDINDQGQILFTNGNAIYLLHPDGRNEQVLSERMIEQVFFLPHIK